MRINLAALLTESAKRFPNQAAIILDNIRLTYSQLDQFSNRFANSLNRLGVKRGDKVAVMLPNVPQFPVVYYGILKLGAVVVPFNVLYKSYEIEHIIKDSGATTLVAWESFVDEAAAAVQRTPTCRHLVVAQAPGSPNALPTGDNLYRLDDLLNEASPVFELTPTQAQDTAVILYTSGTTGKPKGAELTHVSMLINAQTAGEKLFHLKVEDVAIGVLPLFHSFGQTAMLNAFLLSGASVSLIARFEPEKVLEVIQRDKITHFLGVPTMFFGLLISPNNQRYDTGSLRLSVSGGAAMPVEVLQNFEKRFGVPVLEGYGLSETSPIASFNILERPRKAGSIGLPIWGVEMKVFDSTDNEVPQGEVGEIVVRGHCLFKGYYNNPNATAEAMRNEWFHTGDLGWMDQDGYFSIVDRVKDMIIRGGFNIYPREIEEVIYQHPAVGEAAVIGVPDPKMGEEVKAFVVAKPDSSVDEQELIDFVKSRLAAYKYPRQIMLVESLPKGPTGKILKKELRKALDSD